MSSGRCGRRSVLGMHEGRHQNGKVLRATPSQVERWDPTDRTWEACPWMRPEALFIGSDLSTDDITAEQAAELTTGT